MHEDHGPVFGQHDVRLARQVFAVKPESVAERVKESAHPHLRLRVAAPDRRHVAAALLRRVNISHKA